MQQAKWFERKFDFTDPQNIFPSILERLEGTALRLEAKLNSIPPLLLTRRIGDTWTIKENAGHLADLEPLWQGRFSDIQNGVREMRVTDLQNNATTFAGHNEKPVGAIIESFRQLRQHTMVLLENIDEETVFRSALHPRLKTPMRTMDLFLFVADHDDHHLARITELVKLMR